MARVQPIKNLFITKKEIDQLTINSEPSPEVGWCACFMDEQYTVLNIGPISRDYDEILEFCRNKNNGKWPAWSPQVLREDGSVTSRSGYPRVVRLSRYRDE